MSELKGVYLSEYYSDINQVRQYVNERIDSLKQLLDERKVQLNIQLDRIEEDASNDEGKSKKLIEELIDYEKTMIELFGLECSHLATIKSNIESLESDLSRKKLYFQWRDEIIIDNLEWLGVIAYESNDVYERIESNFKAQFSNTPQAEKAEENVTVISEGNPKGEQANIEKETISPAKKPPKIMKKPKVNPRELIKSETEITTPVTSPPSLYDDIIRPDFKMKTDTISTKREVEVIIPIESHELADDDEIEVFNKSTDHPDTSITYANLLVDCEDRGYQPSASVTSLTNKPTRTIVHSRYQTQLTTYKSENIHETATVYGTGATKERPWITIPVYKKSNSMNETDVEHSYQIIDESTLIDLVQVDEKKKDIKEWVRDVPVLKWGDQGKGISQLNTPKGVCVSEKGHIFVAEKGNNRVQVFSPNGNHLYMFGEKSGNNAMIEPHGVWVTKSSVYITLPKIHTVQMHTLQGWFIKKKSKEGKEKGKFIFPLGITGDNLRGNLYICDTGNNRIQIFDMSLNFIKVMKTVTQLYRPSDIKVIDTGNLVIVLDRSPRCIHVFKPSGESIKDIIEVHSFPKLINPLHLAVDTQGNILLSDYSSNCIHVFTDQGEYIWCLGEERIGKPFIEPNGIAFDIQGRLVTVCNKKKDQLQIFEL